MAGTSTRGTTAAGGRPTADRRSTTGGRRRGMGRRATDPLATEVGAGMARHLEEEAARAGAARGTGAD